jgi:hypothetical protein
MALPKFEYTISMVQRSLGLAKMNLTIVSCQVLLVLVEMH